MGTNYYLYEKPECEHCGHQPRPRHIGKSSAGWCFALRVYPDEGINTLDDWRPLFEAGQIKNDYDEEISSEKMLRSITDRSGAKLPWTDRGLKENSAIAGPNNLARAAGYSVVGHGEGTWDYIDGEFS